MLFTTTKRTVSLYSKSISSSSDINPQGDSKLLKAICEDYRINFDLHIREENVIIFSGPKGELTTRSS